MAKKKKIKEKIKEGVKEIKKKVAELEELKEALDDDVVGVDGFDEGGIFDEDLEFVEGEPSGAFDIGDNMLTAAPAVESWAGKDLEEEVRRGHNEWDWKPEEEFVGGDIYNPSSGGGDAYGASNRGGDVYGASGGAYASSSAGGGAYAAAEGSYDTQSGGNNLKTYNEDDNRGSRSMLEVVGFKDQQKKEREDFTREHAVYDAGKAA